MCVNMYVGAHVCAWPQAPRELGAAAGAVGSWGLQALGELGGRRLVGEWGPQAQWAPQTRKNILGSQTNMVELHCAYLSVQMYVCMCMYVCNSYVLFSVDVYM